MASKHHKPVAIASHHNEAQLSKAQKSFNNLVRQINSKRSRLTAWDQAIPAYQAKYASTMIPLLDEEAELQRKLIFILDDSFSNKSITKTERKQMRDAIADLSADLLCRLDDAGLKAIYNKHSGSDFDLEEAEELMMLKTAFEQAMGIDLGDNVEINSPEDIMRHAQAQMAEKFAQQEAETLANEAQARPKKKSAKQIAKEALLEAEASQASQSIREVYRKLAGALHPDREQDPQERDRKTALMQRVNQAYAKNNLLQLLELQLELEHIDQTSINSISEDRLKHYNKVLKEQVSELDQELYHIEESFRMQFGISPFEKISPDNILRKLDQDIVQVKQGIVDIGRDMQSFTDIKMVKAWLKDLRRQPVNDYFDDMPF